MYKTKVASFSGFFSANHSQDTVESTTEKDNQPDTDDLPEIDGDFADDLCD